MKIIKNFFLVLFLFCSITVMSVVANADVIYIPNAPGVNNSFITVGNVSALRNERIVIPVSLRENPGFTYLKVDIEYDESVLKLVDVINGEVCPALTEGKYYIWSADQNVTKEGLLMFLVFDVARSAELGETTVTVNFIEFTNYDEDSYVNINPAQGVVGVYCNHRELISNNGFGPVWGGIVENGDVIEPTCTTPGCIIKRCLYCSEIIDKQYSAPLGHTYIPTVTAPTCTAMGYTTYTCACGDSYVADYADAKGHAYAPEVTAPTCTAMGYTTYTCACGDSYVADYADAKGHAYAPEVTAPTCTAMGYTTYTCACGDSYVSEYTEFMGHAYGEWEVKKEATKKEEGISERHCSNDGCEESEIKKISALGPVKIPVLEISVALIAAGMLLLFILMIRHTKVQKSGKKG